jgi:hypothetical protein
MPAKTIFDHSAAVGADATIACDITSGHAYLACGALSLAGVLLAVPLPASFKIICERVEPLQGVAEFLTT